MTIYGWLFNFFPKSETLQSVKLSKRPMREPSNQTAGHYGEWEQMGTGRTEAAEEQGEDSRQWRMDGDRGEDTLFYTITICLINVMRNSINTE